VSVFRPAARTNDPDGREWEIYAYRIKLPRRTRLRRWIPELVAAAVAARKSDEWTIEAITWSPHRTSYTWKTTREYRGQVLAQVEGGIARGGVPRPRNAAYVGADL
jgi:hypothetical protein